MFLVLCFLVYIPTLWNSYVVDDFVVYKTTPKEKPKNKWKELWLQFLGSAYWNDQLEEGRQVTNKFAHATSILIHVVTCTLIYFAFRAIAGNDVAYLAAILFALNPANSEVSIWLSGRWYGFVTIIALVCWLCPWTMAILALIGLYLPRNLVALTFFPLVFLTLPTTMSLFALYMIPNIYKCGWIFRPKDNPKFDSYKANPEAMVIHPRKIIIFFKFLGYYFVNGLFAFQTATYHEYNSEFVSTKKGILKSYRADVYFFIGIMFVCLLIANFMYDYKVALLGLFWFFVTIGMWCNFVTTGQMHVGLRYSYLPNVGLMLFLAANVINYPYIAGGFIFWYLRQLLYTMVLYKNDWWHNTFQIISEPKFYYSWLMHGNMMFARGHFQAAFADYTEGTYYEPDNFKLHYNMSSACVALGNIEAAIRCLEKAKTCQLIGQENVMKDGIESRKILIGNIIQSQQQGKKVNLRLEDLTIII